MFTSRNGLSSGAWKLPLRLTKQPNRRETSQRLLQSHAQKQQQSRRNTPCISSSLQFQKRSIQSSALTIQHTTNPRTKTPKEELTFGTTLSDHMLLIEWDTKNKWGAPKIVPYEDLKISPAASVLHYALGCFEGLKAYKTLPDASSSSSSSSSVRLFRPDCNMERLSQSMERLQMPCHDFDQTELLECIKQLVKLDQDWIPEGEGYSLYLRPTAIATHPFLGLAAPEQILLYCITSPVGPYYKSGFNPVRLTADTDYVRAWPGGTGDRKVGANYGPTMKPAAEAAAEGYDQILWLFGPDKAITEVGSMNVFFLLEKKESEMGDNGGKKLELVTPPLTRGDILPGVTRRSVLELTKSWGEFDVVERFPLMDEIRDAAQEGRLVEAFGAGTAAVVSPISCIRYEGEDIEVKATGLVTQRIWDEITGIQYGKTAGPEGWSVEI